MSVGRGQPCGAQRNRGTEQLRSLASGRVAGLPQASRVLPWLGPLWPPRSFLQGPARAGKARYPDPIRMLARLLPTMHGDTAWDPVLGLRPPGQAHTTGRGGTVTQGSRQARPCLFPGLCGPWLPVPVLLSPGAGAARGLREGTCGPIPVLRCILLACHTPAPGNVTPTCAGLMRRVPATHLSLIGPGMLGLHQDQRGVLWPSTVAWCHFPPKSPTQRGRCLEHRPQAIYINMFAADTSIQTFLGLIKMFKLELAYLWISPFC